MTIVTTKQQEQQKQELISRQQAKLINNKAFKIYFLGVK